MTADARILLVEDDPQDVELTVRAFRSENVQSRIEVVRDGEEALDYLFCRGEYKSRPTDQPPTLVLLDLKLPKSRRAAGTAGSEGQRRMPVYSGGCVIVLRRAAGHRRELQAGSQQLHSEAGGYR